MNLVFREYDADTDREQLGDVFSQMFRRGEPFADNDEWFDKDSSYYVADQDGRLVGGFIVGHMTASLGSRAVRCGGVAGVAVRPEARQGGVGTAMVRWGIDRMKADGYALSHLYAFRETWYRRLGWEVCGSRIKVTCPASRFPRISETLPVRELVGGQNWREVEPVYRAFASRYRGMNSRTAEQWNTVVHGTKNLTRLYAMGDPIEAYCVVHVNTAFWEEQHVAEVAWSSRRGYDGLIAFLRSLATNKTAISWFEPSDTPFRASYADQGVAFTQDRPIMYRILDVPAALSALPSEGSGEFSVLVHDPELQTNSGIWKVVYDDSGVVVSEGSNADLEIDIGRLTQAVLGEPSLDTLVDQGVVKCSSEGARKQASGLLRPARAYCMDFF